MHLLPVAALCTCETLCVPPLLSASSNNLRYTSSAASASHSTLLDMATAVLLLLHVLLLSRSFYATTASYGYASPRVTSGLLSLYTFTEGAGNSAATSSADQSGYATPVLGDLTNINVDPLSSTWTAGRAGLHLSGTGTQNRAVSTYNTATLVSLLSAPNAFTFELWFSPANASHSMP